MATLEEEFDPAAPAWPAGPDTATYFDRAHFWLRTDALREVVAAFSGGPESAKVLELLPEGGIPQLALAMKLWSAATLDTRRGHERQLAPRVHFSANQRQTLVRAAKPLGLWVSRQPVTRNARVVILGGTVTANRLRTRLAASLVCAGIAAEIVAVGGARPLQPWETELLGASHGPESTLASEVDHLSWTAKQMPGLGGAFYERCAQQEHSADAHVPLTVLEAQPSRLGYRPNTLDCYWALQQLHSCPATIIITSAIYQPYTYFLLAPHLPKAKHTEIIGTRSLLTNDESLNAQLIGQEIHASIQAAAALLCAE